MDQGRRLHRLERQIWELQAWRNESMANLECWTAVGAHGATRQLRLGERWDDLESPVQLGVTLDNPAPSGSLLEFFAEGDGLVFLDDRLAGTVSPFEREVSLADARQIIVEVSPNDSFGLVGRHARLITARVVQPNLEIRNLVRSLLLAWETCAHLPNHQVTPLLLQAIDESLALIRLPSDASTVLKRLRVLRDDLKLNLEVSRSLDHHYHYVTPLRAIEHLLGETAQIENLVDYPATSSRSAKPAGFLESTDYLSGKIEELARQFPRVGRLAATSHAHLDVAWLWPLSETRRKVRHTFANVLLLMERFPNFHFTASSAQLYAYVQQDDPELFEQVRARINEGRWETIGGMWLEPDCNLPSGEAMARHLLYGQRYFEREFGQRSSVAWLPDTFGLAANLPQILAGGGMSSFFTQKLSWNDTNKFPHDLWLWEGLDGTRLTAHSFENPIGGYNGQVTPESLETTWSNFRGKDRHPESLFTFGMGDGGRGPTSEMLERIKLLERYPVLPAIRQSTAAQFFDGIEAVGLPVWVGELYLEFHRGTYTTQARLKRLNRMAEHRLQEAETAAALVSLARGTYPKAELDEEWTALLRNQFHDILPGSSIREVNEQAEQELGTVVRRSIEIRDQAIERLVDIDGAIGDQPTRHIRVFNPQGFERPLSVVVPSQVDGDTFRVITASGREIPWQRTADGKLLLHDPKSTVPGVGFIDLEIIDAPQRETPTGVKVSDLTIENDLITVRIDAYGSIASFYDKRVGCEIFDGTGNQLRIYDDLPSAWEAWNLTDTSNMAGEAISEIESLAVIEDGPLRTCIETRLRYGASHVVQRYLLRAGSARLDIETEIDWHERRKLLRAVFPLNLRSANATFETAFGAVQRPTHRNTSWDTARFEVPAHRWVDMSEAGYGVSLLNNGRYGHSALGNVLGLSLLRSPADPDPLADLGHHEFTYSVYPHLGEWHAGGTVSEAIGLNSPMIGKLLNNGSSVPGRTWLKIEGLTLAALKQAEDSNDLVLRLYDPFGRHGVAVIMPDFPVERAVLTNLLEEPFEQLIAEADNSFRLTYRPFQILTLLLRPE